VLVHRNLVLRLCLLLCAGASPALAANDELILLSRFQKLRLPLEDRVLGQGELTADEIELYGMPHSKPSGGLQDLDRVLLVLHSLHLDFVELELRGGRGAIWGDADLASLLMQQQRADADPLHQPALIPGLPGRPPLPQTLGSVERGRLESIHEIYVEDHVAWRQGRSSLVFAEQMYLHVLEQRGVLHQVAGYLETPYKNSQVPFQIRAESLRILGRNHLQALGVKLSTCVYGEPHFHVESGKSALFWEQQDTSTDLASLQRPTQVTVRAEETVLAIEDVPSLPLPPFAIEVSTGEPLPIKEVRVGGSSAYGTYLQTLWANEFRRIGESVHRALGIDAPFEGEWRTNLDAYSRRGVGIGPGAYYTSPGLYEGESGAYYLYDLADEDRSRLPVAEPGGSGDPFRPDIDPPHRVRAFTRNRFHPFPETRFDVESHYFSDENFQQEFFEEEFKEAKEPETYGHLVWQRNTMRSRALYRNRLNDFDTQVDSLPQISFDQVSEPLFSIPGTEILSDAEQPAQVLLTQAHDAAYLRLHPADGANLSSEHYLRGDSLLELSSAMQLGPFGLHPYASGRVTAYDRRATSKDNIGRLLGVVGARVQLPLHRSYSTDLPWMNINGMRHIALLDAGYENVYASSRDPQELVNIDSVDTLDERQEYLLGLRQRLQTWRNGQIVDFFELDMEVPLFPKEKRDSPTGRTAGFLRTDLVYRPGLSQEWLQGLALFSESEWDLDRHHFEVFNVGLGWSPLERWYGSVSFRKLRGSSRVLTGFVDFELTDKWSLAYFNQYDLRFSEGLEERFTLRRHGHDFLFELAVEHDQAEGDTSVSIGIQPMFLTRGDRGYSSNRGQRPALYEDPTSTGHQSSY
jgi:hypothetical protein